MDDVLLSGLLQACLRMATPILITALGSIYSEKAGLMNIGLEGMMLCGAFFAFAAVFLGGSVWIGVLVAGLCGSLLGLAFAYLTVTKPTSQAVVGAALNMFALGLTGFAYRSLVGVTGAVVSIEQFPSLKIPILSSIPFLGPALFEQNILVYLTFVAVPLVWYSLWRTGWGYELRAVGEHPRAADSLGINVFLMRYQASIICGALSGIGGAYLSLAHANTFIEGMAAGRGFIAMAVVIFGKWNPFGAVLGALLFGAADALQLRMQAIGINIPYHFMLMLPYILTMTVLAGAVGKARPPAAEGTPYIR
jgi:ABC-type uncharacterized transport system permease subunit